MEKFDEINIKISGELIKESKMKYKNPKVSKDIIGFDLSYSVDKSKEIFNSNNKFHIVQASVFTLPFKNGIFDKLVIFLK